MRHFTCFAILAGLVATPALAQEPDAAPVVAAERAFAADARVMGIAGSFNKWSVPEAIVIGGGQAQRIGEAYPDGPRPADEPLLEWWPNFAGIARSGDLGFTTGGVAVDGRRTGHYFTIWKRQPDGAWKWVYDGGSGASAADVPGPDSEPVILPLGPELLEVVRRGERSSGVPRAERAMAAVRAEEATLAAAAAVDQKAAHLAVLADNGRLYVAPPAGDRTRCVRERPVRLARDLPVRTGRGRRRLGLRRHGLDLRPGGMGARRAGADGPLRPALAASGRRVEACAGPADPGPGPAAPSRRRLSRPICLS